MPLRWQDVERYRGTGAGADPARPDDGPEVEGHAFTVPDEDDAKRADGGLAGPRPR